MKEKWWQSLWDALAPHLARWLAARIADWTGRKKE